MEEILSLLSSHVLPHWPFVAVTAVFSVVGQVMGKSVFTRERAYRKSKPSSFYKFWESQSFWWWGRETLSLHQIVSGLLLGLIWQNPEGASPAWPLVASCVYFAGAGVSSLFAFSFVRGYLKRKGIDFELPGTPGVPSVPAPPPPSTPPSKEDDNS